MYSSCECCDLFLKIFTLPVGIYMHINISIAISKTLLDH